ncbi:MAG: hypothetical protein ISR65_04955 [Bacteriovoracaceae bacterium]|nr:hypothetical protein [Bacteriovoracaceae bacterium]
MKTNLSVLYIGNDLRYWEGIQNYFTQHYGFLQYNFNQFYDEKMNVYSLFFETKKKRPQIIFMDLSSNGPKHISLIRMLRSDETTQKFAVISLMAIDDRGTYLEKVMHTGLLFNHFKQVELDALVYDSLYLVYPEHVREPGYAKASLELLVKAYHRAKINKFNLKFIELESNLHIKKGDSFNVTSKIPAKFLSYRGMMIKEELDYTTDPQMVFQHIADFKYAPIPIKEEGDTDESLKLKMIAYKDSIKAEQTSLNAWVKKEMLYATKSRETRVLTIDKELSFYRVDEANDGNYTCIPQMQVSDPERMIKKYRPHIVIYRLETPPEPTDEEKEEEQRLMRAGKTPIKKVYNDADTLKKMLAIIQFYELKSEVFVVDCDPQLTQVIKNATGYDKLFPIKQKMSFDLIGTIAEKRFAKLKVKRQAKIDQTVAVLKKKDPVKYLKVNKKMFEQTQFFTTSEDTTHYAEIEKEIFITALTESEVAIASDVKLEMNSIIRLDVPTPLYLTIVPEVLTGRALKPVAYHTHTYRALIHSIDEGQRELLRRCVNAATVNKEGSQSTLEDIIKKADTSLPNKKDK